MTRRSWWRAPVLGVILAARGRIGPTLAVLACAAAATSSLALALALPGLLHTRETKVADRVGHYAVDDRSSAYKGLSQVLYAARTGSFQGRLLSRYVTAEISTAATPPVPPGLSRLPEPGTSWVSPAVARSIGTNPTLAAGLGRVVGTISQAGLAYPDELVIWTGVTAAGMEQRLPAISQGDDPSFGLAAHKVARFGPGQAGGLATYADDDSGLSPQIVVLLRAAGLTAGLPVVLLVVTCSGLLRARRDRSVQALRTLGVSERAAAAMTGCEAAAVSALGAILGIVAARWLAVPVRRVTPSEAKWFPSDLHVPLGAASIVAVGLLLAATAVAVSQGRAAGRARSGRRQRLPILIFAGIALCVVVLLWPARTSEALPPWLSFAGLAAIALLLAGLAPALPWLVSATARVLERSTSATIHLAAERLRHDPRTASAGAAALALALVASGVVTAIVAEVEITATERYTGLARPDLALAAVTSARETALPGVRVAVVAASVRLADGRQLDEQAVITDCRRYLELLRSSVQNDCRSAPLIIDQATAHADIPAGAAVRLSPDNGGTHIVLAGASRATLPFLGGVASPLDGVSLLVDTSTWSHAGGQPVLSAQLVSIPAGGEDNFRAALLRVDVGSVLVTAPTSALARRARIDTYAIWFQTGLFLTLIICGTYTIVAAAAASNEQRRAQAFLGVLGVPRRILIRAWLTHTTVPVGLAVSAGLGLALLITAAFDHLARLPLILPRAVVNEAGTISGLLGLVLVGCALVRTSSHVDIAALRSRE